MKNKEALGRESLDRESLLSLIQDSMLENMLSDLKDPEKRNPQLYNAIIKELQRNGINCVPKAGEDGDNALASLLKATKENFELDYGANGLVN